eukprot:455650-Pleurochrysis_carterae.AAC.1
MGASSGPLRLTSSQEEFLKVKQEELLPSHTIRVRYHHIMLRSVQHGAAAAACAHTAASHTLASA